MPTRTLLFTDVVDSTRMNERLGDTRAAEVWAAHDRRARDLLARHRGREIGRSDGFFLMFETAADAAAYALAYHAAIADLPIAARAGLHVGPVTLRENPPEHVAHGATPIEVDGLATPYAARIMALARGRQTLISAATRDALGDALPAGAVVEGHGHYRLKGIEEPVEVFELGVPGSAPFAPPADVDKAYRVARHGASWRPLRDIPNNLPAERDTFVGRTDEMHALATRLDAGARLLEIVGPGGTGKTRLARRYGWTWLGDWPGGVYFCDLSEARTLEGVCFAVASALDVRLGAGDPIAQLGHAIAGRGHCLVILDNFEQVVQHAPGTAGRWLDRATEAAFLVTSRERLHLPGEAVFPVEPLPLDADAIELFATRARAQRADFVVDERNRAAVADIVRLVDGLPLAIELAAARVRVLSPAQLVERMRDRFQVLVGLRGAVARQVTLRAAIDWSWDLLAPWEQAALAQCSVFEGGFTLEAAEAVLDLSAWPHAPAAIDVVQALSDKSLLHSWTPAVQRRYDIDEPYFGMYVSIREYAAAKLAALGADAERSSQERHGRYYALFGTDAAREARSRAGGVRRLHALTLEIDNLTTACHRAVRRRDGEVAGATYCAAWEVLSQRGPGSSAVALGDHVLAMEDLPAALRVTALLARSRALRRTGRPERARADSDEALARAREANDRRLESRVLAELGNLERESGRSDDARAYLAAGLAIAAELRDRHEEGRLLAFLGIVHAEQGRFEDARNCFAAALATLKDVGDRMMEGVVTTNLAQTLHDQGRLDEALDWMQQALAIHREVGSRREEGIVGANLGMLYMRQGLVEDCRATLDAALAVARDVGDRRLEGHVIGAMADVMREPDRVAEALELAQRAADIHRETGNRRDEGWLQTVFARLFGLQGRHGEALDAIVHGESLLRAVGDSLGLVTLLCDHARIAITDGDPDAARAAFAEAQAIAREAGVAPDSETDRGLKEIAALLR
ncbi:MAG TPA: tetratricopeptide repeat protein [Casimicrobiaceae bacterium]|nr:tetratricopeptide repeat protein [Casimicrobiaceae bacterium]